MLLMILGLMGLLVWYPEIVANTQKEHYDSNYSTLDLFHNRWRKGRACLLDATLSFQRPREKTTYLIIQIKHIFFT